MRKKETVIKAMPIAARETNRELRKPSVAANATCTAGTTRLSSTANATRTAGTTGFPAPAPGCLAPPRAVPPYLLAVCLFA